MKTIGVLGGLGPQATIDFETRVHRAAQRLIPQSANTGYPPMVVLYCRHPPVLVTERLAHRLPLEPDPRLFEAASRLGGMCDFIVIPSNATHRFAPQIERAAGRPVLNIIDLTIKEIGRRGWTRVGVLGLGEPTIYIAPLRELGITCEIVAPDLRAKLDDGIASLMEGAESDDSRAAARDAVEELRSRQVQGVVLGCTEIPLLLPAGASVAHDLLNPLELLAQAAVRRAMG